MNIPTTREFLNGWTKGSDVCLVYRNSSGKRCIQQFEYEWYFFVRTDAAKRHSGLFDKLKGLGLIQRTESYVMDRSFTKVYCVNENLYPSQIREGHNDPKTLVLQWFREAGIQTYEADLTSLKRLMIDQELKISSRYKVVFLDIETQDEDDQGRRLDLNIGAYPILSFSAELSNGRQFFVCHRSEEYVLEQLQRFLDAADIIATYNGNKFDIPYIRDRQILHGEYYSWKRIVQVDFFERIFDLYQFDQEIERYDLDYISNHFTPDVPKFKRGNRSIYSMFKEFLAGTNKDLKTYNCTDTAILRHLNERERIIAFMIQLCRMTRSFLSQFHKSWLIDSFILTQGAEHGRPLISKDPYATKVGKFDGAHVIEPKPGRYEHVDVFDYNSLYPNVMRSWNIGTEDDTMVTGDELDMAGLDWRDQGLTRGATPHVDVYYSQERPSMLALAVAIFLDGRAEIRAEMEIIEAERGKEAAKEFAHYKTLDLIQKVWKILSNSGFGITASPRTRYFDKRVAESITHGGRVCLDMGVEWFMANLFNVIAGDTDSLFTQLFGSKPEALLPMFHKEMHGWLEERWGVKNPTIELGWEKHYDILILCGKKHYGGFLRNGKFDGMGLDHKKRVTIPIARKLLKMLFVKLCKSDEPAEFYDDWLIKLRERILYAPVPTKRLEDFSIQKKIKSAPESYAPGKALPLHVQIWQDLKSAGHEVWLPYVVRYVAVVPDGNRQGKKDGIALDLLTGSGRELDREHYWNIEIFSKMNRILPAVFPDHDWAKFDSNVVRSREIYREKILKVLRGKHPVKFHKAFKDVPYSILNPAQRAEVLTEAGVDDDRRREMELELHRWQEKRLKKYLSPDDIEADCKICCEKTEQVQGIRHGSVHRYTSRLCISCGNEVSEKTERKISDAS